MQKEIMSAENIAETLKRAGFSNTQVRATVNLFQRLEEPTFYQATLPSGAAKQQAGAYPATAEAIRSGSAAFSGLSSSKVSETCR